jgi:hypothetical protein
MKSYLKSKSIALAAVVSLAASGCATVGPDGKQTTDVAATAGMGAGLGAVVGGLIGGKRGALVGAALGGGAGYLIGTDARKKELENARLAANEITTSTRGYLKPVVYSQQYQDVASGQKVDGLKYVDIPLPIAQMTDKKTGALTDKGLEALVKLQAVADKAGNGAMEIIVPANLKASTFAALVQAAPHAKIVVGDGDKVTARLNAKPLESTGGVKVLAA